MLPGGRLLSSGGVEPPRQMSSWSLAWRNLVRQKRRTLLMGAVVAFGFAAFALAGGFVAQSFEGLKEGTIRSIGDLQIVDRRAVTRSEESTLEFGLANAGRARAIAARDPAVAAVLPRIEFVGLATNGTKSVPYLGVGVDPQPEATATLSRELIAAGRYLSSADGEEVVLGTGLASALGVKTGDRITLMATTRDGSLNAVDGVVAGLVDVRIKELNDRYLAAGIGLVSRLLETSETVSKLVVFLRKGSDENRVAKRLEQSLTAAGFPIAIRHWAELAVFYSQVKLLYIGIFGFVGAVLVVIVILSAAIVMTMAVTERTREIGTLRAIGTRPAGILKMFLAEGAVLALAGCLAGALVALVVRAILNASGIILPPPPGATHGMPINVKFYPLAYVAGIAAMVGTMLVASWLPARRASRISIVEALTHV
jgi:putative ABC transport system permease protein